MKKLLRFYLASCRKRRLRAIGMVIWLLRMLHDVEYDEMRSKEDLLEGLDAEGGGPCARRKYSEIEEEYLSCEYAQSFLWSAIDDLECAY